MQEEKSIQPSKCAIPLKNAVAHLDLIELFVPLVPPGGPWTTLWEPLQ